MDAHNIFRTCILAVFLLTRSISAEILNEFIHHHESLKLEPQLSFVRLDHLVAKIHFTAHNRAFSLHLKTDRNLFSKDFKLKVHNRGVVQHQYIDTTQFVTGFVAGERWNSLVHGRVSATQFEGIIHSQGEMYHIEPLSRYRGPNEAQDHVVIYKASDVRYDRNISCGSGAHYSNMKRLQDSAKRQWNSHHELRKRQSADDDNTCLIHVYADYEFYQNVGLEDAANTLSEMALHISTANGYYRSSQFLINGVQTTGFGIAINGADIIADNQPSNNPLYGSFTSDELLEAFGSYFTFDDVCLGHLFTYRDFRGILGIAYVADPDGGSGGICERRQQTYRGMMNLNIGFTTLYNYGRKVPQTTSFLTTAHEIGHNFGSPHDPEGECTPGASVGNYIMFPSVSDGSKENNKKFSICSRDIMGRTITARRGICFSREPQEQNCGNGIVEGDEECDCGSDNATLCHEKDPCCVPGNCTFIDGAECSPAASSCCTNDCKIQEDTSVLCREGDDECLSSSYCDGRNPNCPLPDRKTGIPCNNDNNVCNNGICSGSVCLLHDAQLCFCSGEYEQQQCHVCCVFPGEQECVSTFTRPDVKNSTILSGFPCANYTGFCDDEMNCIKADPDDPLNKLKNLIPSFRSFVKWLESSWYYILAGVILTIIIIILLQVTYRRKKLKSQQTPQQRAADEREESVRLIPSSGGRIRRERDDITQL